MRKDKKKLQIICTPPPLKRKISFRKRRQPPALVKVIKPFQQIYNLPALKLEEGETVKGTKIFENGQCMGKQDFFHLFM